MILRLFLFWRIGLFLVAYLGALAFAVIPNGALGSPSKNNSFDFWLSWAQWDGGHYMEIIRGGYQEVSNVAFMPLFPLASKALAVITQNHLFAGLLLGNVSFFLFLYVLNRWIARDFSKNIAKNTVIAYLLFPTSFYAVSFYSEGLFLLMASLAFYLYFLKKNYGSSLFACLAFATRFVGFSIFIAFALGYIKEFVVKRRGADLRKLAITLLCGLAAFAVISWILLFPYGRGFAAIISVQSFWGREVTDPITTIFSYVFPMIFLEQRPVMDYFDLLFTVGSLALLIRFAKRLNIALWVYSMLAILIPVSTGTLSGMPRYLLGSFGFFILLAQFLESKPRLRVSYFFLSLIVQVFFLVRFFNGYWVS